MSHARKNIRDALKRCAPGQEHFEAAQAAGWYCTTTDRAGVDKVLAALDLLTIAHRALLEGETLEVVGNTGPYGTAAQQRAWAAGKLSAACYAIIHARGLLEERVKVAEREAALKRRVEAMRIEARAAWKAANITVPYREPRPKGTPEWAN